MNPIDPGTGLTVLGGAIGLKDIIIKILGPTADYIGGGVQHWAEKRINNFNLIISKAQAKLGNKMNESGTVPPRILHGILSEGTMNDDRLAAEYFGGVLASSRTHSGRDDRGTAYIALLSGMSTYQIRTHYIMYTLARRIFAGYDFKGDVTKLLELEIFLPYSIYLLGMEFNNEEKTHLGAIINHVIVGLRLQELINRDAIYRYGRVEFIKEDYAEATEAGILWTPSINGIALYLWAHGLGDLKFQEFFNSTLKLEIQENINIPDGSKATKYKPPVADG